MRTGLRVRNMAFAGKLVICAAVLHNLCINAGDNGADLEDGDSNDENDQQGGPANQNEVETRRQQLLHYFH